MIGRLGKGPVRQGGVFLGSRAVNGVLAVLQILLVTSAVGPSEAGRFFLLWTAAWLLSVVVKFGADGILPRAVAEAGVAGPRTCRSAVPGGGARTGRRADAADHGRARHPARALEFGLVVGLAVSWAANGIVAALLKAHGRADLSGIVGSVVWPWPYARAARGDRRRRGLATIAELTLLASVLSLSAAVAVPSAASARARWWTCSAAAGGVPLGQDESARRC